MAVKIMSFGNRFFEHFLLPKEKEESCSVRLDVTVPLLFPERAIPGGVLDGVLRDRTVTTQTILSCNQAKSFPDALHSATFQLASCVDGSTNDFVWNIAFFYQDKVYRQYFPTSAKGAGVCAAPIAINQRRNSPSAF